jgi:D-glucosaminate-6-phosphate ammonia-lyase
LKAYNPYEKYGLRRVINAATCLTRLGGSRPHPDVFKAMEDASKAYIQIPALQAWAGEKIARVTGAEAGLPTAGAVNALTLAAAACIMKGTELEEYDPLGPSSPHRIIQRLPMHTEGLRTEFVVQKSDRNTYDHAVECAGGRIVEAGTEEGTTVEELEAAITDRTAAFYFTLRGSKKGLPLDTYIETAHRSGVPVIVDAAPDLRPKKILTHYIEKGVDLVVFSGGKHLGGPNNTGILAGRGDLIKLAHLQAYPFDGVGRGAKMSRETIVGLVVALGKYLEKDDEALFRAWDEKAKWMADQLTGVPGLKAGVTYEYTVEDGEPMTPLAYVTLDERAGMTARELQARLKDGDPIIETLYEPAFLIDDYQGKLTMNPEHMLEGDEEIVVERIKEILGSPS